MIEELMVTRICELVGKFEDGPEEITWNDPVLFPFLCKVLPYFDLQNSKLEIRKSFLLLLFLKV